MKVEAAIIDLEERRNQILALEDAERIAIKLKETNPINMDYYIDWKWGVKPRIQIRLFEVRNMNDINTIIRFLGKHGYLLITKPLIVETWVVWDFGDFKLTTFFNSDDENACKFKQVGTKEVPVYEIDCPGLNDDFAMEKQRAEGK